jgi:hypothetical protein
MANGYGFAIISFCEFGPLSADDTGWRNGNDYAQVRFDELLNDFLCMLNAPGPNWIYLPPRPFS